MARNRRSAPLKTAQLEYLDLSSLAPYVKNARTHSDEQIGQIAASMREWGWTMPVLVAEGCDGAEDGEIIAGHGRVLAAARIYEVGEGLRMAGGDEIPRGKVPVMRAKGWTHEQRRGYVIADNQLTLAGGWDEAVLRTELVDLREAGFDLTMLGFDDTGLAAILDTRGVVNADPEEVPDAPAVPVSRLGDVWLLGRHRLTCGDATDPSAVAQALAGAKPHLMVTDPPYGVEYDPDWRNHAGDLEGGRALGKVDNDDRVDWREAWALFPGGVAYVWHASYFVGAAQASLEAAGFVVRSHIIWAKQHFIISRGDYHWQHEPCWYAVRKGSRGNWSGDRKQSTIWNIHAQIGWESARPNNKDKSTGHGTQKPIECMKRPIENNSKPGDGVYDPFVGSGTTVVACEISGRRCIAIELSPVYVDVCVLRWQGVTGNEAVLEATAETYAEVAASRLNVAPV